MQDWQQYSPEERFILWVAEWDRTRSRLDMSGQLAVLDTLAGMIPDGPLTAIQELELWANECALGAAWRELRSAFESDLWSQLHYLPPHYEGMPSWYTRLFYSLPLPYRRAAFFLGLLDFMVLHLRPQNPERFQALRSWLMAVARWAHCVDRAGLGTTLELPANHPMRRSAADIPSIPSPPQAR